MPNQEIQNAINNLFATGKSQKVYIQPNEKQVTIENNMQDSIVNEDIIESKPSRTNINVPLKFRVQEYESDFYSAMDTSWYNDEVAEYKLYIYKKIGKLYGQVLNVVTEKVIDLGYTLKEIVNGVHDDEIKTIINYVQKEMTNQIAYYEAYDRSIPLNLRNQKYNFRITDSNWYLLEETEYRHYIANKYPNLSSQDLTIITNKAIELGYTTDDVLIGLADEKINNIVTAYKTYLTKKEEKTLAGPKVVLKSWEDLLIEYLYYRFPEISKEQETAIIKSMKVQNVSEKTILSGAKDEEMRAIAIRVSMSASVAKTKEDIKPSKAEYSSKEIGKKGLTVLTSLVMIATGVTLTGAALEIKNYYDDKNNRETVSEMMHDLSKYDMNKQIIVQGNYVYDHNETAKYLFDIAKNNPDQFVIALLDWYAPSDDYNRKYVYNRFEGMALQDENLKYLVADCANFSEVLYKAGLIFTDPKAAELETDAALKDKLLSQIEKEVDELAKTLNAQYVSSLNTQEIINEDGTGSPKR